MKWDESVRIRRKPKDKEVAVQDAYTCDWGFDIEQVGLPFQNLSAFLDNIQRLFFSQSSLTIKVVFQESVVWFVWILFGPELLVCRYVHRWCLNL